MKAKMFIVMIVMLVVTTLTSLTVFAKPPLKVTLLGAFYGDPNQTTTYHTLNIAPVQNNVFGVYSPTDTLNGCTIMRFYYGLGVDSVESFDLQIKKLSDTIETNKSLGLGSYTIQLVTINSAGTVTAYQNIRTSTQTSYETDTDGKDIYHWRYVSTSGSLSYNALLVSVCFQSFVISTNLMYFELVNFSVNGMTAEEIEVAKDTQATENLIQQANSIMGQSQLMEDELFNDIYVPGNETVQMSQAVGALWQSNYPMVTLMQGNNIIPVMMTFVFALAFFSFLVFGRKGA